MERITPQYTFALFIRYGTVWGVGGILLVNCCCAVR